jgi:hypothetical protein
LRIFLIKIIVFFLLISSVFIVLISLIYIKSPENIGNWFYGVNSSEKPRIILVGSSNIYSNYDYNKLNKYYENYDVLGAHMPATVGFIPLISNLELLNLTSEDIIIFCLPYQLYDPGYLINFYDELPQQILSRKTILNAFRYNPKQTFKNFMAIKPKNYFNYITKSQLIPSISDSLVKINSEQVNLLKIESYVACQKLEEGNFNIVSNSFDKQYLINFMSALNKNIKSNVYFRFPEIHKNRSHINKEKVNFLASNYKFINTYNTTLYDSIYWYDQNYHLNRCGASKNTDFLIEELQFVLLRN